MQSAKWDLQSEQFKFVKYNISKIYQLWNIYKVICLKNVIFDMKLTQLLNITLFLYVMANVLLTKLVLTFV